MLSQCNKICISTTTRGLLCNLSNKPQIPYPACWQKDMRITSPCNSCSYIFMFIKCSKGNIRPSHIPNIDATIHHQGTAGNVVFPLRPPFNVSYRCNGVNCVFQWWLACKIPHLQEISGKVHISGTHIFQMYSLLFSFFLTTSFTADTKLLL